MKGLKILSALVVLAIAAVLLPSIALAHAFYDHSTPGKSQYLDKAPSSVDLWFSGPLSERDDQQLTLKDDHGKTVTNVSVAVDPADPSHVRMPLPTALDNGRYTVVWNLVAGDFMAAKGSYRFYVGVRPTQAQLDDDARLTESGMITRTSGSSKAPLFAAVGGGAAVLILGIGFILWRQRRAY